VSRRRSSIVELFPCPVCEGVNEALRLWILHCLQFANCCCFPFTWIQCILLDMVKGCVLNMFIPCFLHVYAAYQLNQVNKCLLLAGRPFIFAPSSITTAITLLAPLFLMTFTNNCDFVTIVSGSNTFQKNGLSSWNNKINDLSVIYTCPSITYFGCTFSLCIFDLDKLEKFARLFCLTVCGTWYTCIEL
jgi:hypothetical protein